MTRLTYIKPTKHMLPIILLLSLCTTTLHAQEIKTSPTTPNKTLKTQVPQIKTTPKQQERVVFLLSGYEFFPKRADLDKVGSAKEITSILLSIAQNPKQSTLQRIRAIDAMGYYNMAFTNAYLVQRINVDLKTVASKGQRRFARSQRHHAILSIARAQGELALPMMQKMMSHSNFQVRLTAIDAIGKHCGKKGKATLKKLQKADKNPVVQRMLKKHL